MTTQNTNIPASPVSPGDLDIQTIQAEIDKLQTSNLNFNEKLELIIQLKTKLAPSVLKEVFKNSPNPDISLIATRACGILKNTADLIIKKRELEVSDELNPHSPKFQRSFAWFLELFHSAVVELGLDEVQINNLFASLSSRLVGWEDNLVKQLKGLSSKANEVIENPFLQSLKKSEIETSGEVVKEKKPRGRKKRKIEDEAA